MGAGIERPRPPPPRRGRRAEDPLDEVGVALPSSPLLLLPAASKGLGGIRRLGHHRPGVGGGRSVWVVILVVLLLVMGVLGVMLRYSQRQSVPCAVSYTHLTLPTIPLV